MDYYDRALARYRSHITDQRHQLTTLLGDIVVEELARRGQNCVTVDLGAGSGELVNEIATRTGHRVSAVDLSPAMVEAARRNGIEVTLADCTTWLQNLGLEIDVAIAADFIEHLDRDAQLRFMDSVSARLAAGGVLIVKTVNARGLLSRQIMYGDITHQAFLTPESATQLAGLAELRVERVIATDPRRCDRFGPARRLIWRAISFAAYGIRLVETGKRQRIWTENMILVMTRTAPDQPSLGGPCRPQGRC